jgi:hypothetical protein
MKPNDLSKEKGLDIYCIISFIANNEMYHLRKYIYIVINMESLLFLDLGKLKIKSIEISIQGFLGTSKGVYNT